MKKLSVVFFVLFIGFHTNAQKFDGYVVTNKNDTITCKYFVPTIKFNSAFLDVSSISDEINIYNKGEKVKYSSKELHSFLIKGTKMGDLKFVSLKYDNYLRFYHEVIVGKLMYYRYYIRIGNSGIYQFGFILKDDKFIELQGYDYREKIGNFIIDFPELYEKWINSKSTKVKKLEEVIKLYNEHFKN
jgi:hypothetical protein